jgi:hypothetical protein
MYPKAISLSLMSNKIDQATELKALKATPSLLGLNLFKKIRQW